MESMDQIIHKEKEAKRKLQAKGQLPIGLKDNRTIGLGYHSRQEPNVQEVEGLLDNSNSGKSRASTQLKNFEIDEYLYQLINEGMITEQFVPFFAKACHVLGLQTVNRLKINALNGNNKQKLFAYKVKGAIQLYYKLKFDNVTDDIN